MSVKLIIGLLFYSKTINSDKYMTLTKLFAHLTEEELLYLRFQQHSAAVYTAYDYVIALE